MSKLKPVPKVKRVWVVFNAEDFPLGATKLASEADNWEREAEYKHTGEYVQEYVLPAPKTSKKK